MQSLRIMPSLTRNRNASRNVRFRCLMTNRDGTGYPPRFNRTAISSTVMRGSRKTILRNASLVVRGFNSYPILSDNALTHPAVFEKANDFSKRFGLNPSLQLSVVGTANSQSIALTVLVGNRSLITCARSHPVRCNKPMVRFTRLARYLSTNRLVCFPRFVSRSSLIASLTNLLTWLSPMSDHLTCL